MDIHLTLHIVQAEVLAITRQEVLVHQGVQVLQKARANLTHQKARAKVQAVTLIRVQINQAVLQNQVLSQSSLMQSMTRV